MISTRSLNAAWLAGLLSNLFCLAVIAQTNDQQRVELPPVVVLATNDWSEIVAQSQPQAISALPAEKLEQAGASSVLDVTRFVPNFSQAHAGVGSYADTYALRGIGNTEFLSDPAVILYVDDVPFGATVGYTTELLAIDHLDVYRGPQGSRFGKNAEAGVINIVTRQPTDSLEAEASGEWSSFDTQQYKASASGPLVKDKLFFAAAGRYSLSDGFIKNTYLGTHPDKQNELEGRASLLWIPGDNWQVDFTATGNRSDDGVGLTPIAGSWRQTMSDFDGSDDWTANSLSLRVKGNLSGIALTSVTARRDFHLSPLTVDPDFSPLPGNTVINTWVETQWSEELRLRPVSPAERWDWNAGFFYSVVDTDVKRLLSFTLPPPDGSLTDDLVQREHYNTYALFGDVTRTFFEKFDVTLGLRLEYDNRKWRGSRTTTPGTPAPPLDEEKDYFNAAPKLTLAYHLTDEVMIYGSTGLGFKPGCFSAVIDDPSLREAKTEHLWASEIGVKSTWLNGRLTANVALFYYDVDDYQVEQFDPSLSLAIANASHARSLGAELELTARPATGWEFSGFFGYTDAKLASYTNPFNGATVHDTRPQGVAEFNGGISEQYRHHSGLFERVEYVAVGDTHYDTANTSQFEQTAYGLLNARIGFERSHFGIYLFGENLTNTRYFAKKTEALNSGSPGRPQTFGVMVVAKY